MMIALLGTAAALFAVSADHARTPFDAAFDAAGARWNVPSNLLRAIARQESSMVATAVSPANKDGTRDFGLMGMNEKTCRTLGVTPDALLRDPALAIDKGAEWLAILRKELGGRLTSFSWPMAYNVGSDLKPAGAGNAYAASVFFQWALFDLGRGLASHPSTPANAPLAGPTALSGVPCGCPPGLPAAIPGLGALSASTRGRTTPAPVAKAVDHGTGGGSGGHDEFVTT